MSLEDVKGVGEVTSAKLIESGVNTADQLSVLHPEELKAILGISLKQAKEIINSARDLAFRDVKIYTADEYEKHVDDSIRYVSTGSSTLDSFLRGGWRSQSTNGLYGLQASGKTQMVNTAVLNCIDAGWDACIIETESNTFDVPRFKQIAEARNLNWDGSKVHIYPGSYVGTIHAQFRGYLYMWRRAEEQSLDVGLLAVDSFNAKFRRAFSGREMFPARSTEFGRHIDYLEEFGKRFNSTILLTFQCGVTPDDKGALGDQMKYHGPFYPVGGSLVQHNVNTWISLQQVKGGEKSDKVYKASITDHNYLPSESFKFIINEYGVEDL